MWGEGLHLVGAVKPGEHLPHRPNFKIPPCEGVAAEQGLLILRVVYRGVAQGIGAGGGRCKVKQCPHLFHEGRAILRANHCSLRIAIRESLNIKRRRAASFTFQRLSQPALCGLQRGQDRRFRL